MLDFFLKHPRAVGETYLEHMAVALSYGLPLIAAGLACVVHAVVPALFERTGSRAIVNLHSRLIATRRRVGDSDAVEYAI
jgi:Family of unknown function (DUF6356)